MRYRTRFTTDLNFYNLVSELDKIQETAKTNLLNSECIVHLANYYDHFRQYADIVKTRCFSAFSYPGQAFPTICTRLEYTGIGMTLSRAAAPARPVARRSKYEISLGGTIRKPLLLPGFIDAGKDDCGFSLYVLEYHEKEAVF